MIADLFAGPGGWDCAARPGHKINQDDIDRLGEDEARERYGDRAGTDAPRLTVEQAAALQSSPLGGRGRATRAARPARSATPYPHCSPRPSCGS